jgi:phosphohistidine phosphatase
MIELLDGVDLVAHSPWARAEQTAQFVAAAFKAEAVECPELVPDRPMSDLLAWLRTRREERVALVGHEPQLSRFASRLLAGGEKSVLALKKSQALLLEMRSLGPGQAILLWSASPKSLRALSRR